MRPTAGSWRSWPKSITTSCGGHRGTLGGLVGGLEAGTAANAKAITTVAQRSADFPRCVGESRAGRLSPDQVGVIAAGAADGSDEHYAQLAAVATANQLRTAIKLQPRPDPKASITKNADEHHSWWRITLPHAEAANVEAAINAHREALITEWKAAREASGENAPPRPGDLDAFLRLVEASWNAELVMSSITKGHRRQEVEGVDSGVSWTVR